MRLLAVVRHAVGGIRTYLKYVYRHLPSDRYDITIVAVGTPESRLIPVDLSMHDVRLIETEESAGTRGLLQGLARTLAAERFDMVHSHGMTAGVVTAAANLYFKRPHVLTPHGSLGDADFAPPWGGVKRRALGFLLRRVDVIQLVGQEAEANLHSYFPELERLGNTAVILNGVDTERFVAARLAREAEPERAVDGGRFQFAFLGRIMPEKGFGYLVDAVEILAGRSPCPRFEVLVFTEGCFIREEQARIREKRIDDFFNFKGFVADVAPILADVGAVVIPSISEACCLLAMEGLVTGTPLIASHCIGVRELTAGSPALEVPPGDAPALAAAMLNMMATYEARKASARRYASLAVPRFDSRRVARELEALFARVASRTSARTDAPGRVRTNA